jgi:hypothetical protein
VDEAHPHTKGPLKRLGAALIVAVVVITAAIALVLTMVVLQNKTVASDVAAFSEPVPKGQGYLDVLVKIVALDLNKETMGLELECVPKSGLANGSGKLKFPVTLTLGVSAAGTQQVRVLPAGATGHIFTVELDLSGNVAKYPVDRHTTTLWISAEAKVVEMEPLPIRLQVNGAWPGLDINAAAPPQIMNPLDLSPRRLDIAVIRSTITSIVVYFSIVLTWILIASVVGMTYAVAVKGRRVHVEMIAYFATLLFALTAFRDSLPGAPPMGALSDYLAFFWGYAAAIIAVGVLSGVWLWRREHTATPAPVAADPSGTAPPPQTTDPEGDS